MLAWKKELVNSMTRYFTYKAFSAMVLLAMIAATASCQQIGLGGGMQAKPRPATSSAGRPSGTLDIPPSHRRPPVAGPQVSRASVPPGQASQGAPAGAQTTRSPAVTSQIEAPTSSVAASHGQINTQPGVASIPTPKPDLPSLAYLLNRAPEASAADAVRPVVPPPATTDTIRVGLLLPLSGANAVIGKAMLNAAQLAVFDFADRQLELLPVDTHGTPQGAQAAVATAIADGVQIILGPLLAGSVRAVAPASRAAHVPVIAFSSDRRISGNGVYTMGFLPEDHVRRVVSYAASRGITRFGALAPDNAYGATVFEALRAIAAKLGAEVVAARFYDPSAGDFTDVVRSLADYDNRRQALIEQRKELAKIDDEVSRQALKRLESLQTIGDLPFDALLIADGGKRLLSVAALLPFYDIDPSKVRMLGTGQWDVAGLGAEPALMGGWYAAADPSARQGFLQQYKQAYGKAPPRLATLAYDATALAAVLARSEGGPDFSERTLMTASGFDGRDGIFRFRASGVAERGLAVMQVRQRDAKAIQPAPTTFQAAIN
jgi:branched-chain amino acid transport system substrate-binding protein